MNSPHFPYVLDNEALMGRILIGKVQKQLANGVTLKVPASVAGKRQALLVMGEDVTL